MYSDSLFQNLIGATVRNIFINSDFLKFETDKGDFCFTVYGDCCSTSYFYDFIGVERLLENGAIKAFDEIADMPQPTTDKDSYDVTVAYGYRITTEDKEYGEVSSVLSFRNDSDGHYGGSMFITDSIPDSVPEIKSDWQYNPLDKNQ